MLRLVARGLSNRQIARELVVSLATVKTHINHLLAKTACRDRAALVGFAYQHGAHRLIREPTNQPPGR